MTISPSPSLLFSSASISDAITEAVDLLVTQTLLNKNPAICHLVPSIEICCLFFCRARLTSPEYSALTQEMKQFAGRVVNSSSENFAQECKSLINAEVLYILLQCNPPSASSDPGQGLCWAPCPLSLTQITTAPKPEAAKIAFSEGVSEANGFWELGFKHVNGLVSYRLSCTLSIYARIHLVTSDVLYSSFNAILIAGLSFFLHRLPCFPHRCVPVSCAKFTSSVRVWQVFH